MKQKFDSEYIEELFNYASDKNGVLWHCIKKRLNWPIEDDVVEFQWKRDCYAKALYASGNSVSFSFIPNENLIMTLDVVKDGHEETIAINESEWCAWLSNAGQASAEDDSIFQKGVINSVPSQRVAKNLLLKAIKDKHKRAILERIYDEMAEDREHFNNDWTLKCDKNVLAAKKVLAANIRYITIVLGVNIQDELANLFVKGGAKTGRKVNKPTRYTKFQNFNGSLNEDKYIKKLGGKIDDYLDKRKDPARREELLTYLEKNYVFPYVAILLASHR